MFLITSDIINISFIKYNTVLWFQSEQDPGKRLGGKKIFFWTQQFNKEAVEINTIKLCSAHQELRLVNEIAWRHVCFSTFPHWRYETSLFRRHPPPPPAAMVTSLMDGP